jgi:hypothetical protein
MNFMQKSGKALLLAVVVLASSLTAHAGLLPVTGGTVNVDGDKVRYTYAVVLTSDSILKSGDYFTIFDFAGYEATTNTQPAGWTFNVSNTGGNPNGVVADDDPSLPNLTWTYSGDPITGQVGLGNFMAKTSFTDQVSDSFTGSSHRTDGTTERNITDVLAPAQGTSVPPGVPEPSTLLLIAAGVPLLASRLFRRQSVEA